MSLQQARDRGKSITNIPICILGGLGTARNMGICRARVVRRDNLLGTHGQVVICILNRQIRRTALKDNRLKI